jgi:hypothetical protein
MKLLLGMLAIGSCVFWVAINSFRPLDQTLGFLVLGGILLAGGTVLVWATKCGDVDSSDSYLPKARYVGTASLPWLLAAALLLNAVLDRSVPAQHHVTVVGKSESAVRETITITSWRPGKSVEVIPVDAGLYSKLPQRGPIIVAVKPGFLRLPWVTGFERVYQMNARTK